LFQKRTQAIELSIPEHLMTLQPLECANQCAALQLATDGAAGLSPLDEAGILENAEVLHESRQRHCKRFGEHAHRAFAIPELG
jgi:hypothetical protein